MPIEIQDRELFGLYLASVKAETQENIAKRIYADNQKVHDLKSDVMQLKRDKAALNETIQELYEKNAQLQEQLSNLS